MNCVFRGIPAGYSDGKRNDWLEGRGPKLVLMGYIDDATNKVFGRFYDYEGVEPAMDSLEGYVRLVKELRLAGVCSKDEANRFLDSYWPKHNRRFSRPALRPDDLHRPLPKGLNLRDIFCLKGSRTINNGYMVRWKGRLLVISNPSIAIRRRQTQILEHFDGSLAIRFNGRNLDYREVQDVKPGPRPAPEEKKAPEKRKGQYIPPPNHPWRRWEPQLHHNSYLERI